MGIDPRGEALRRVIVAVGFKGKITHLDPNRTVSGTLKILPTRKRPEVSPEGSTSTLSPASGGDYFSSSPGGY